MSRIVLLTGVSASGKSSLQNELVKRGWKLPLNFSTRVPRNSNAYKIDDEGDYISDEFNEYVFLDRETFGKKMINGDFIEITQYGGNFYGISKNSVLNREGNIVIVVDPIGRAQLMETLTRMGIDYETYYIYIDKETQLNRFRKRGDNEEEIRKRVRDFEWFHPSNKCVRLNGKIDTEILADLIEKG